MRLQFDICDLLLFSNPTKASEYCSGAMTLATLERDTSLMAKAANYEGILATLQAHYLTGVERFQEAIRLYEATGDREGVAKLLNNIGVIYSMLENYRESIVYYQECADLNLELQDHEGVTFNLYNIAGDYMVLEEYDSSRVYIDSLIQYQSDHGEYLSPSTLLGEWYLSNEMLDSAEYHLYESISYHRKLEEEPQITSDQLSLGELYMKKGFFNTSASYLDSAEAIATRNNLNTELMTVHELRADLLEKQARFEEAFTSQQKFIALKDSLDELNNFNRISELNARFESEKKEQELAEKEAMLLQQDADKKYQRKIFSLVIGFIAIVLILVTVNLIRKKKTNRILNLQNHEISEQRGKILSSINYAQKIQSAILPPEEEIKKHLPNAFIYFRPKDIVSGDFYWFASIEGKYFIATIDCTGHGVPGAFMSLIAHSKLNRVVNELGYRDPGEILNKVHLEIMESLNQNGGSHATQDGMDVSFCVIDPYAMDIHYAGARNPIVLVQENQLKEIKPDHLSIGGTFFSEKHQSNGGFSTKRLPYKPGDMLYLFTDGYIDQFGGDQNKKLNKTGFHSLLNRLSQNGFDHSKDHLDDEFATWKGKNEQIDDILIIGIKLD